MMACRSAVVRRFPARCCTRGWGDCTAGPRDAARTAARQNRFVVRRTLRRQYCSGQSGAKSDVGSERVSVSVAIPCGATAGVLGSLAYVAPNAHATLATVSTACVNLRLRALANSGIGGGLVMIPWLRAMTTMSQHKVNGTALLAGTMACSVRCVCCIRHP